MPFGVSNSFKRGTVKTYARQRAHIEYFDDVGRPRKKICMDATGHVVEKILAGDLQIATPATQTTKQVQGSLSQEQAHADVASSSTAPSSPPPADRTLFSSEAPPSDSELSSLPSSPPQMPSPARLPRKPTFSFLKRKRCDADDDQPAHPLATITANPQKNPRPMKKAMKQMQIDLGGEVRKTCRACGMEYIPSVKEDAELHKEFCNMNAGGIEMGKPFLKDDSVKKLRCDTGLFSDKEAAVVVDQGSSLAARNKARRILDVVNKELGAANIDDDRLWANIDGSSGERKMHSKRKADPGIERRAGRFKVFLHLIDHRCVGFCLAEKISHAFPVVSGTVRPDDGEMAPTTMSSSIRYSTSAEIVLLGISRIWTSKSYRGQGFATNLLDCARSNFFYGVEVPRHLVAFSQPTESGARLARRWFKSETRWHVYEGNQS